MRRHIVLVGLPGSGKSTVGRAVAERIGAPFSDVDEIVEAESGLTVEELIAQDGEPAFRRRERTAVRHLTKGPPSVIAPGGGWAASPGSLEFAGPSSFIIYLDVTLDEAAGRVGDGASRPLLHGDVRDRLRELLRVRLPRYQLADAVVGNNGAFLDAVEAVTHLARESAGWQDHHHST